MACRGEFVRGADTLPPFYSLRCENLRLSGYQRSSALSNPIMDWYRIPYNLLQSSRFILDCVAE